MGMPSGDSPAKAQAYYHYLNAHQLTMQRPATWEVRWHDLAWLWGFAIALSMQGPFIPAVGVFLAELRGEIIEAYGFENSRPVLQT